MVAELRYRSAIPGSSDRIYPSRAPFASAMATHVHRGAAVGITGDSVARVTSLGVAALATAGEAAV